MGDDVKLREGSKLLILNEVSQVSEQQLVNWKLFPMKRSKKERLIDAIKSGKQISSASIRVY